MTKHQIPTIKQNHKRKLTLAIAVLALVINGLLVYSLLNNLSSPKFPHSRTPYPTWYGAAPRPRLATFSLAPATTSVASNSTFTLTINLTSVSPLTGADALLSFDPAYLSVEEIIAGDFFSLYPRLTFDNDRGRVIITGINTENAEKQSAPLTDAGSGTVFLGHGVAFINDPNQATGNPKKVDAAGGGRQKAQFARITLRALSPGTTTISFDFKQDATTASTAVRSNDAKNILSHTNNATIKIQ